SLANLGHAERLHENRIWTAPSHICSSRRSSQTTHLQRNRQKLQIRTPDALQTKLAPPLPFSSAQVIEAGFDLLLLRWKALITRVVSEEKRSLIHSLEWPDPDYRIR